MELIDIGANLGSNQFRSDLGEVITRARQAKVSGQVVTGTSLAGSRRALEISEGEADLWCTAGVHPHDAKTWDGSVEAGLRELYQRREKVVAVGECGLDFNRNFSPPDDQRRAFGAQLALAVETGLPLFLHQRDAHDDFLAMLREVWSDLRGGAVVHCFTGGPEEAAAYVELGCMIGITGWVTDERRGGDLRAAVGSEALPAERLLIETDAPYLMPATVRPKPKSRRNEPMHLGLVAQAVAELRGVGAEEIAAATTDNARGFFRLGE